MAENGNGEFVRIGNREIYDKLQELHTDLANRDARFHKRLLRMEIIVYGILTGVVGYIFDLKDIATGQG